MRKHRLDWLDFIVYVAMTVWFIGTAVILANDQVPLCDVDGEAVPGSVVEVRMFIDGQQFQSWQAGMCPRAIDRVVEKLDEMVVPGGPF